MVVIPRSLKRFSLPTLFYKGRPHGPITVSSTFAGRKAIKNPAEPERFIHV
jgi:hypothetical protein